MQYKINTSIEKANEGIDMILAKGGSFDGENFLVSSVGGTLEYSDGTLLITIPVKPWFASWDMIEEEIRKFFAN
jgi:hypothetical protein